MTRKGHDILAAARTFPQSPFLPAAALRGQVLWMGRGEGRGFGFLDALYDASGRSPVFFPLFLFAFGQNENRRSHEDRLAIAENRIEKGGLPPLGAERLLLSVSRLAPAVSKRACQRILDGWPASPLAPTARLGLVRAAVFSRDWDEALSLAEAMAKDPGNKDALEVALFETGRSAVFHKSWEKALAALRWHTRLFPDSPVGNGASMLESRALEALGDVEGAARCLEEMLERRGLDVGTARALLQETGEEPRRLALGAYLRAHGGIEKALRDDPPWPKGAGLCGNAVAEWQRDATRARLECLASLQDWDEYRKICDERIRWGSGLLGPNSEFAVALIESYRQEGRLGDAAVELQRIEDETGARVAGSFEPPWIQNRLPTPLSAQEARARNPAVREGFAYLEVALAQDEGNVSRLIEILTTKSPNPRFATYPELAHKALVQLGSRAVDPLLRATRDALRAGAEWNALRFVRILSEIEDPRIEPFFRRLAEDLPRGDVRTTVEGILGSWRLAREGR